MIPSFETLLIFLAAALVVVISPGPANLYVVARAIGQGLRGGLLATLGLAAGGLVHVAGAALGLSAVFQYSPLLYTVMKVIGAVYLVWLGIGLLRARASGERPEALAGAAKSDRRILAESALVEILNPKVALFYLAFLPQFVDTAAGSVALQSLFLGGLFTLMALICDLAYAMAAGRAAETFRNSGTARLLLDRLSGSALIGIGVWMASGARS